MTKKFVRLLPGDVISLGLSEAGLLADQTRTFEEQKSRQGKKERKKESKKERKKNVSENFFYS